MTDHGGLVLTLGDGHVVGDVGEDGGLHVVALGAEAVAAEQALGALGLAALDVRHDLLELDVVDLRAKVADRHGSLGLVVALGAQGLGELDDLGDEGVVDVLVDQDARRGAAALAHVDEEADVAVDRRLVEVGVLADDHGGLAAKLQGDLLQVGLGGHRDDLVADGGGAREGHLLDVHVARDQGARRVAVAVHHVEDARRDAGLDEEVAHHEAGERGLLRELHHHGAAHRDRGGDLPRLHEQPAQRSHVSARIDEAKKEASRRQRTGSSTG